MQVLEALVVTHFAKLECVHGRSQRQGIFRKETRRASEEQTYLGAETSPCAFLNLLALVFPCSRLNS